MKILLELDDSPEIRQALMYLRDSVLPSEVEFWSGFVPDRGPDMAQNQLKDLKQAKRIAEAYSAILQAIEKVTPP